MNNACNNLNKLVTLNLLNEEVNKSKHVKLKKRSTFIYYKYIHRNVTNK